MSKQAYYFSHDSNAFNDPRILAMRCQYKLEGYGAYWAIIEMLRDEEDYQIDISQVFSFDAIALRLHCDRTEFAEQFINDCINKFKLFESDGTYFWSNSLRRRMLIKDEKTKKARASAEARWRKKPNNNSVDDANAMQTQCEGNAIKESKVKEKKENNTSLGFKTIWEIWLNKKEKPKALKKYQELIKKGINHELIKKAVEGNCRYITETNTATNFQKYLERFLKNEDLEDWADDTFVNLQISPNRQNHQSPKNNSLEKITTETFAFMQSSDFSRVQIQCNDPFRLSAINEFLKMVGGINIFKKNITNSWDSKTYKQQFIEVYQRMIQTNKKLSVFNEQNSHIFKWNVTNEI